MKKPQARLVLITGGASGIGRLMALEYARLGMHVRIWDLDAQAISTLEAEAKNRELDIRGQVCNVADREEVYRLAADLTGHEGPVGILVNNAGVVSGKTLLETPDDRIVRTFEVNTLAAFWTTKAFLPGMLAADSGKLVTIASAAGLIGVTGLADYSASKFAVVGYNEALRMELRRKKSKVSTLVVCPFFINTGMFDGVKTRFSLLLPILDPVKVARKIVRTSFRNKKRLIMPHFVRSVYLLRLFPTGFMDAMAGFFGISNSMDDFRGRK